VAGEQSQLTQANLSTGATGSFASSSVDLHSSDSAVLLEGTKQAYLDGQATVGGTETSTNQSLVSPASSLGKLSLSASRQTASSDASGSVSRSIAMSATDGSSPEAPVSAPNQRQAADLSANTPRTEMQNQKLASERSKNQEAPQSQELTAATTGLGSSLTRSPNRGATEARVSNPDSSQASVAGSSQAQAAAELQANTLSPQIDQTAASSVSDNFAVPLLPGNTGDGKASISGLLRPMRGAGNFNSTQSHNRLLAKQGSSRTASSPSMDTSAMASEMASANAVAGPEGSSAAGLATSKSGTESRDAFATLDAEGVEGRPAWIHAGTQRAEAGFQDPALGWVGIRANANGGGVHAELVPGSADAAQTLGSHLAGLNAYLAEHHTPVETLTLTAPENGLGSDQGAGHGMQQGTGQQSGQGLAQGADSGSQFGGSRSPTSASEATALPAELAGSAQPVWLGGEHISVMA
jgi:hypothetical protein